MPETPQPIVQPVEGGGILYDAARLSKPENALFTPAYWADRSALSAAAGGRGGIAFIDPAKAGLIARSAAVIPATTAAGVTAVKATTGTATPETAAAGTAPTTAEWVLRHYRRGGFAAKLSGDRYFWLGERRTRSFSEWRLLLRLRQMNLPVPAPIAARYLRRGLLYRADLITERLSATTLAEQMKGGRIAADDWFTVGQTVARFHAAGVHHADLNANNILLGDASAGDILPGGGSCYLLDFDRGRIRSRGAWEHQVLARLKRSLEKIRGQNPGSEFGVVEWTVLMKGYSEPTVLPRDASPS